MPIPDLGETAFGEVEDEIAGEGVGREEQRNREVLGGGVRNKLSGKGRRSESELPNVLGCYVCAYDGRTAVNQVL